MARGLVATLRELEQIAQKLPHATCRIDDLTQVILAGAVQDRSASFFGHVAESLYLAQRFLEIVGGDEGKFLQFLVYQFES